MASEFSRDSISERRRRRSTNPLIATRYQLAQVMEDFELGACIIATEDGRLFAAPEFLDPHDADLLAAVAPLATEEPESFAVWEALATCHAEFGPSRVIAQEFWAYDQPMIMVTVARRLDTSSSSTYRAILGVRRIARQSHARQVA